MQKRAIWAIGLCFWALLFGSFSSSVMASPVGLSFSIPGFADAFTSALERHQREGAPHSFSWDREEVSEFKVTSRHFSLPIRYHWVGSDKHSLIVVEGYRVPRGVSLDQVFLKVTADAIEKRSDAEREELRQVYRDLSVILFDLFLPRKESDTARDQLEALLASSLDQGKNKNDNTQYDTDFASVILRATFETENEQTVQLLQTTIWSIRKTVQK